MTYDSLNRIPFMKPDNYDPATDDEYWSGILSPNADDAEDYSDDEVDIKAEKQ
jgi:hypothetical protein